MGRKKKKECSGKWDQNDSRRRSVLGAVNNHVEEVERIDLRGASVLFISERKNSFKDEYILITIGQWHDAGRAFLQFI